jgi:hypothetical protein
MPKIAIDYENTIFYKIYCKTSGVTDLYIGHTTNFVQRKYAHKQTCENSKYKGYACKLYKFIRDHGGWDNWNMDIIAFHACEDSHSARQQEQHYFDEYKATLNSAKPLLTPKITTTQEKKKKVIRRCDVCNVSFYTEKQQNEHNKTNKHINRSKMMELNKTPYSCKLCNFTTFNSKDYKRHVATKKHETNTKQHELSMFKYICTECDYRTNTTAHYTRHIKSPKHLNVNNSKVICICGASYKYSQGLCKHKKTCKEYLQLTNPEKKQSPQCSDDSEMSDPLQSNMISKQKYLVLATKLDDMENMLDKITKQNTKLIDVVSQQQEKLNYIIPLVGNTNNVDNSVILNEKCNDAVNRMDFVNSAQIQMSDPRDDHRTGGLLTGCVNIDGV